MNRRLYNNQSFVETAIYRVFLIDISENECRDVAVLRLYKDSG
ncbi:hypothetical protein [uncultured Nostoc sp.]